MISLKATKVLIALSLTLLAHVARADDLRNLKRGEPMPAYKLATVDGSSLDSESFKGTVLVMVYLSAEQRSSELAATDAQAIMSQFPADKIKLVYVTADVVQKAYFERFRQDQKLIAPLALDADRALYAKLGLIVFPTTVIVDREGKLSHVVSIHSPDYKHVVDSYIRHTLGSINDDQLQERLKVRASAEGSPKSLASAHRALSRQLREKGRLDASKEELMKAKEQDPTNPEILLDLADLDIAMNDLDEAQKLTEAVLAASPGNRRANQVKGIVLYRRNQLPEAEAVLIEALKLNPDPSRVHYYLGKIYEQQGQTAKAMEHYRLGLQRFLNETDPVTAPSK